MTILVTGSAGHLGEALMRTLRRAGRSARGIDIKDSPFTDRRGSICDRTFIRECMQGIRTVLHPATLHKPHVGTHSNQEFIDVNVTGTLILLEEAASAGVDCLRSGTDFRSTLARDIGSKGYHTPPFEGAPY